MAPHNEGALVRKSLWGHIRTASTNTATRLSSRLLNAGAAGNGHRPLDKDDKRPTMAPLQPHTPTHKRNISSNTTTNRTSGRGRERKFRLSKRMLWRNVSKRNASRDERGDSIRLFELTQARAQASRHNLMLRADSMRERRESANVPLLCEPKRRPSGGADHVRCPLADLTNGEAGIKSPGEITMRSSVAPARDIANATDDEMATEFASRRAVANTQAFGSSYCSFTDTELASLRGYHNAIVTNRFDERSEGDAVVSRKQHTTGSPETKEAASTKTSEPARRNTRKHTPSRERRSPTNESAAAASEASTPKTKLLKTSSSFVVDRIRQLASRGGAGATGGRVRETKATAATAAAAAVSGGEAREVRSAAGTVESPVFWYSGLAMALESENDRKINEEILKNFFLDHDPARVSEVDVLLDAFVSREEVLFERLQLQYPGARLSVSENQQSQSSICSVAVVSVGSNNGAAAETTGENEDHNQAKRRSVATVLVSPEEPLRKGNGTNNGSVLEGGMAGDHVGTQKETSVAAAVAAAAVAGDNRETLPSFTSPKRSVPKMDGEERRGQDIPVSVGPYVELDGSGRSTDYILSALALRTQNAKGPRRKWATNLQNNILRRHMLHAGATNAEADALLRTLANGTFSARKAEMQGELQIKRRVRCVSGESLPPELWRQSSTQSVSSSSSPFAPSRPLCEAVGRGADEEMFDNEADLASGFADVYKGVADVDSSGVAQRELVLCRTQVSNRMCEDCARWKGAVEFSARPDTTSDTNEDSDEQVVGVEPAVAAVGGGGGSSVAGKDKDNEETIRS
jgi:hypothetical protein